MLVGGVAILMHALSAEINGVTGASTLCYCLDPVRYPGNHSIVSPTGWL